MSGGESSGDWDIEIDMTSPSKACCKWPVCFCSSGGGSGRSAVGTGSTPDAAKRDAMSKLKGK